MENPMIWLQNLFDQNVEVSQQSYTEGKTNQDGGQNVFMVVVHG